MSDVAELGLKVDSSQVKTAIGDLNKLSEASKSASQASDQFAASGQKVGVSAGVIESMAKRAGISFEEMRARIEKASSGMSTVFDASKRAADGIVKLNDAASKSGVAGGALASLARVAQGPLSIALQGVTAAASAYFALTDDRGPKTEESLAEQARLIALVRDAYRDAANKAGEFYASSKAIVGLQLELNINALQSNIRGQIAEAIKSSVGVTSNVDILGSSLGTGFLDFSEKLAPFKTAFETLNAEISAGGPAIERFRNAVADIGQANPALRDQAGEILKITQAAGDAADKLNELLRAQRINNGTGTADDRKGLGLSNRVSAPARDPFDSQVMSINRHIAAMKADAAAVDATAGEHARLRAEAQLYEVAQQRGGTATAKQVERLKAVGQAAAAAADALARASIASDLSFERKTALLSSEDVAIAQRLKSIYGNDIPAALASAEAAQMRFNNTLRSLGDLGQDINRSIFVEFGQNIRNGANAFESLRTAGLNALGRISDKLMAMAADNLWSAAFGGAGSSGGGAIGSLLGGIGKLFAAADGGTFGPGWGVVGERGPELIRVNQGSVTVVPNHVSRPYLPGFADGGMLSASGGVTRLPFGPSNAPPAVQITQNIDARGADAAAVARLEVAVARSNRDLERNVTGIMAKYRANTPGSGR